MMSAGLNILSIGATNGKDLQIFWGGRGDVGHDIPPGRSAHVRKTLDPPLLPRSPNTLMSHKRKTVSTTQREGISVECQPPAYRPTEVWATQCTSLNRGEGSVWGKGGRWGVTGAGALYRDTPH